MDEYECIRSVHEILVGKILVGHDLHMELAHLVINHKQLVGIRDLCAAPVFEKIGIKKKVNYMA